MIVTILRKNIDGTVADNTLEHGCGGLNIDATRVGNDVMVSRSMGSLGVMHDDNWESKPIEPTESNGRWPANFILTFREGETETCPVKTLDRQSGISKSTGGRIGNAQGVYSNQGRTGWGTGHAKGDPGFGDEGGASRFFKQFKKEEN